MVKRTALALTVALTISCAHAQAGPEGASATAIGKAEATACCEDTCATAEGGVLSGNFLDLVLGAVSLCTTGVCPI